nr:MAG TPA: hypothetical protein [Caudoviricetes sp.]
MFINHKNLSSKIRGLHKASFLLPCEFFLF